MDLFCTDLELFATDRGLRIAAFYAENESGASLKRRELFRLLGDCQSGDILLIEQVDRLSRLSGVDWDKLKAELQVRQVRVVALDLPTSWMMTASITDDLTGRMFQAINAMMLDMLAAIARKDYEDRRRRQAQGIEKAKNEGRYKGRAEDTSRNGAIVELLKAGQSWSSIVAATSCSRSTLSRLAKRGPSPCSFAAHTLTYCGVHLCTARLANCGLKAHGTPEPHPRRAHRTAPRKPQYRC